MKFTPKTKQELASENLFKEGVHRLVVMKAEEKVSKKGAEMIELLMKGTNEEGKEVFVRDWLMEINMRKLLQFCESAGLADQYSAGDLHAANCVDQTVLASLTVKEGEPDGKGGNYPAKNVVKKYLTEDALPGVQSTTKSSAAEIVDDPIDF